ncbi:MAG: TRAP transporter substrate-binding protein [Peptococcaceae bacterium]
MKKLRKSFIVLVVAVLCGALLLTGCGRKEANNPENGQPAGEEKIVIKFSHPAAADETDPLHRAALLMEEKAEEYSKGKVDIKIYPAGQLGSEQRNVTDIQNGIIQMALVTAGNITPFSPSIGVYDFPYIFKNRDEANKVIDSLWDDLNDLQIQESGTRTLTWLEQGFRVLSNSKKPVTKLEDLKGLKIRVPNNKYMIGTFKAWDAEATPIAWDETFNALQQKVVDGQENPYASLWVSKNYEVQKYVTDIHYKMWLGNIMVDEKWFGSLPEDVQQALIKAGKEVTDDNRQYMLEYENIVKGKLEDNGIVFSGSPEDEDEWQARAMSIWPEFYTELPDISILEKALDVLGRDKP